MYEQQSAVDWGHIMNDSGAELLIVASKAVYERVCHIINAYIISIYIYNIMEL